MTSASGYITSVSRYHPRYESRSSMYTRSLIPWNFTELAEAVPIGILWSEFPSRLHQFAVYESRSKALASLRICADLLEPSLHHHAMNTESACADIFIFFEG